MNGITEKQRFAYFKAFRLACLELELRTREAQDEYRHRAMMEETGKDSIKELNRTGDFDRIMFRFYVDAGEPALAANYSVGDDRRLARMVEVCACQCSQILQSDMESPVAYVAGILKQARFTVNASAINNLYWLDIASRDLFSVFQILDTYRRRLMRRFGLAKGTRITFNVNTVYGRDPETKQVTSVTGEPPREYFHVGRPA